MRCILTVITPPEFGHSATSVPPVRFMLAMIPEYKHLRELSNQRDEMQAEWTGLHCLFAAALSPVPRLIGHSALSMWSHVSQCTQHVAIPAVM